MKSKTLALIAAIAVWPLASQAAESTPLRPPAVPLVTHSPYFSIWSANDALNEGPTRHWTGREQRMTSLIRIDDKTFRLMGSEPSDIEALPQKKVEVLPTVTNYTFGNSQVEVVLSFLSPLLPQDLDILSRPVTYVTWTVRSLDGKSRNVSVYLDMAAEVAVNDPFQEVVAENQAIPGLVAARAGSKDQSILGRSGDDLRIEWGYAYVAAPQAGAKAGIGTFEGSTSAFASTGKLLDKSDAEFPRKAEDGLPVISVAIDLGKVSSQPVSRFAMLAYDEIEMIQYFYENLKPYWTKDGMDAAKLLQASAKDYPALVKASAAFDKALIADLKSAGDDVYAELGSLAYRQSIAAHGLVADANKQPLFFSKENNSNGCIATVDITYPSAPLYLLTSPALMKAMLVPILDYSSTERWKFPFAPHDLGTYPLANGQVYGGGEKSERDQMPVEESGNILLVVAAIAKVEGNTEFADKYWPLLTKWADYLAEKGFDPENQLCTDDFAGHLAHNVNLSMKAIEALGAYAMLAKMRGDTAAYEKYHKIAEGFAKQWIAEAKSGNHTKLAFDQPNSWSQKYNLVWDRILGLNLFPADVAKAELAYYKTKQNKYGLPLDSRRDYTKLDWIFWTATLTGNRDDFVELIKPIRVFLNETPDRVPMTDWYETKEPKQVGFKARSVVGGVFIKLLDNQNTWKKWAAQGEKIPGNWAAQPLPPKIEVILPTAKTWRYTFDKPADNWFAVDFNDSSWQEGQAPFGTDGASEQRNTKWDSSDIWIRNTFTLDSAPKGDFRLWLLHDEDAEVYINGVFAARKGGFSPNFQAVKITPEALATIKVGQPNTMAIHCLQTIGGQMLDAGFAEVIPSK